MNHDILIAKESALGTASQEEREKDEGQRQPGASNLFLAAELAIKDGVDLQAFMAAAYGAYLAANPELRQQLESQHLLAQIDELRRRGRLGEA